MKKNAIIVDFLLYMQYIANHGKHRNYKYINARR
jgi:hypothetical protein